MPPKLSPRTMLLVSKIFDAEKFEEIVQWLEEECGNNGNINKLLRAIDEAHMDWRDLFMAAGFGYDVNAHEAWVKETLDS